MCPLSEEERSLIMVQSPASEMARSFTHARDLLQRAIAGRAFPSAVVEVGTDTQPLWQEAFGALTYEPDAPAATLETIYDLASLTKVLSTTPLAMRAIERGALGLDDAVAAHIPQWSDEDRRSVTVRDLLAHCSGLPGHRHYYREYQGRDAFEAAICREPLEYAPRTRSIYSDLGFMLLGFMLAGGDGLAARFDAFKAQTASAQDLQFNPPAIWQRRTAPTHRDPWRGRVLCGEVDDENAFALGGVAGHAGLFGTAMAVGDQARHLLQVLAGRSGAYNGDTAERFVARVTDVPGSSRALGWDTMLPTSSCGTRLSTRAFGHTGFTGTSLWIDPDRGIYVVLLTNRVHPSRENNAIASVRPAFHDAVIEDLTREDVR
jgi:CubicO group peptidase (beta-lactamase class C family)